MFKQQFAIRSLNTILITADQQLPFMSNDDKLIAIGILRDNGYVITPTDLVKFISFNVSVETGKEILNSVKHIRGSDVEHSTLIGKFPIQDPNQVERSLIAFINHLSNYYLVPEMMQDDKALYQLDEKVNYTHLAVTDSIDQDILQLLTTKIPLSLDHEQFVTLLYTLKDSVLAKVNPLLS